MNVTIFPARNTKPGPDYPLVFGADWGDGWLGCYFLLKIRVEGNSHTRSIEGTVKYLGFWARSPVDDDDAHDYKCEAERASVDALVAHLHEECPNAKIVGKVKGDYGEYSLPR